jgi:hypothetical protein
LEQEGVVIEGGGNLGILGKEKTPLNNKEL